MHCTTWVFVLAVCASTAQAQGGAVAHAQVRSAAPYSFVHSERPAGVQSATSSGYHTDDYRTDGHHTDRRDTIKSDGIDSIPITRAQAVALALKNNPQLQAAREQVAEFRAQRVQAIAIPDPSITASLDEQPGLFRSAPGGEKNIGAGITIPFPDKFRLRNRVANADIDNAESNYTLLQQQITALTAATYDSLLAAMRHRSDLEESQQLTQDFLKRTEAQFNAGTAPKLDVIKARVDVALAQNQLIANARDITTQRSGLNRLIGRPLGGVLAPTDTLSVPRGLPPLDQLERLALASRPELTGLAAERKGAHAATTLAREFWLPDITLGAARDITPGAPSTAFSTGLAFPFPIFFWQHTRGEIAQAQHYERELAATYADLRAQVAQDVHTTYATASTALQQAIYIRDQLLPAATDAYRAILTSYSIGGSSAFEVIDARRTLLDAESQYTDALTDANTARADLERAVSVPLDTIPLAPASISVPAPTSAPASGAPHVR
jgi:cobalt-zinc-cadmium efflux system outer membrane protein